MQQHVCLYLQTTHNKVTKFFGHTVPFYHLPQLSVFGHLFCFALDLFMLWFIFPVFHENRRLFSGYFVHFCIVFQHTTKHVAVLDCKEIIENKTSRLKSLTLSFVEIYMLISIDALPEGLC